MQIPVLKDVLDQMNIPRYEKEGYEADDLIGAISRRCEAEGWECVIVTGDKDSLQLITDQTRVKPVSYTHLDVYKRQELRCGGSTAFAALAAFLTLVFERKRGIIAVHSSDTKEEARYIFYDADNDQRSSAGAAVQVQ